MSKFNTCERYYADTDEFFDELARASVELGNLANSQLVLIEPALEGQPDGVLEVAV